MGAKSRGNWAMNCCLKDCKNRDIKCNVCIRWNEYDPATKEDIRK